MEVVTVGTDGGKACPHCDRVISVANFDLHVVHCQRNLERCDRCGEMVARARSAEHFDELHAQVSCSACGAKLEKSHLAQHKSSQCPKREVICPFCEFTMPAEDSDEHEYHCGSRTDICVYCNKYIMNRERMGHDVMVHGFKYDKGESPTSGEGVNGVEPSEEHWGESGAQRRSRSSLVGKLWVTAALGAVAFLVSAYFGQNRSTSRTPARTLSD